MARDECEYQPEQGEKGADTENKNEQVQLPVRIAFIQSLCAQHMGDDEQDNENQSGTQIGCLRVA